MKQPEPTCGHIPAEAHDEFGNHRMSPCEFRGAGYLQEVNRQFFHPLGVALAVHPGHTVDLDGYFAVCVLDSRHDPEGFVFSDLTAQVEADRAHWIRAEQRRTSNARSALLGYRTARGGAVVQRIGSTVDPGGES